MAGHQHEAWQIRESEGPEGGRYCAACGDQLPVDTDPKPIDMEADRERQASQR